MLIVEDGTGTNPDADSFGTLVDARIYAAKYGYSLPDNDDEADVVLRKGAQNVGLNNLKGEPLLITQPLAIPRTGVYCNGQEMEVDQQLDLAFKAQIIYADAWTTGVIVRGNDNGREVKKNEVVGSVSQEFFESYKTSDSVVVTEAVDALGCLIDELSNSFTLRTVRV